MKKSDNREKICVQEGRRGKKIREGWGQKVILRRKNVTVGRGSDNTREVCEGRE